MTHHKAAMRAIVHPLLGTMPDARLATQCGIPLSTLYHWRIKAKIAPYRLHSTTARYLRLLRHHPDGLTAQQVSSALGVTRQGAFLGLHVLARRGDIACVTLPNPRRYGGRTHLLLWQIAQEDTHAPTPCH